MDQKGKRISTTSGNKYELFMDEILPPDYPVRVSGKGFELVEANGSIKILSREEYSNDDIFEVKTKQTHKT